MEPKDKCAIWKTPATISSSGSDGDKIDSPRAGGLYTVSRTAKATLEGLADIDQKTRLTLWLVEQRRLGVQYPDITSNTLKNLTNYRLPKVDERADAMLRFLYDNTQSIGDDFCIFERENDEGNYPLLACTGSESPKELIFLAEYCNDNGWIHFEKVPEVDAFDTIFEENYQPEFYFFRLVLKPQGYARIDELNGKGAATSQAFDAMWFDDTMTDAYQNGIELAIRDAGYEPLRIDRKEHNNKIDDEIIAEIRRSRFVVADFTQGRKGARGGVYYEAGYAQGLNIPVIFTCRKNALKKVHFDTRQYNHIDWADVEDLRKRLAERISATIGDGPNFKRQK